MQLIDGARSAVDLRRWRRKHPLAAARLWHPVCPSCKAPLRWIAGRGPHDFTCVNGKCERWRTLIEASSQRYPLSLNIELALSVFGGNGAGKTYLVAQLCTAVAMGREHPDVAAWVKANGVLPELIPPKGGLVIASSLTGSLSKDTLRPAVAKYMLPGSTWRNRDSNQQAEVVPRERCGDGKIIFKSNEQGREKFQGYPCPLFVLDEEHDADVYEECLQRTDRCRWEGRSGYGVLSMTPLKGFTWVHDEFVDVDTRTDGTRAAWIWGENNPFLDQKARKKKLERKSLSEAMRAARDRGVFGNPEGLVYRTWRRDMHVIKPFTVPNSWHWIEGIDFGDRNPFAYGLYAFDSGNDRLYRVAEHYAAEMPLSEHAKIIKALRKRWRVNERRLYTFADPAQAGQRRSLSYEHGISTIKATKGIADGIMACQERLRYDAAVEPGFYCFDTCRHFVREIEGYRWAERKVKTDQPELPLKRDDHAMDEWRYVCRGLARLRLAA